MGTIASVLQWTCRNCNLINPTECLKCLRCGNQRILIDGDTQKRNCIENNSNFRSAPSEKENRKCDTEEHPGAGYVEITSDG